jgi:phosphatidylglycerophosphatase A
MPNGNLPPGVRRASPAALIASFFGVGLLRPAPGTWGSAAALVPGWALIQMGGSAALLTAIIGASLVGWWACAVIGRQGGVSDPPGVVIDEVAGQWIALLPASLNPLHFLLAFAAFRLFDITKPFPARWIDRKMKTGLGAMLDDIVAGIYAAIVVAIAVRFMP